MKKLNYNTVIAKTVLSYAVFAGLWILFSDKILGLCPFPRTQKQISQYTRAGALCL